MRWGEEKREKIQVICHERVLYEHEKLIKEVLPITAYTLVLSFIVGVVLCLLVIWGASDFLGNFAEDGFVYVLKLPIVILGVLIVLLPFAILALDLLEDLILYQRIKKKKYTVIDDILLASSSSEVYRESIWQRLRSLKRRYEVPHYATFYFSVAGRHPVSQGMYEFSQTGDRFYVLMLQGKKPKIYAVYDQKSYRWEGDPVPVHAEM